MRSCLNAEMSPVYLSQHNGWMALFPMLVLPHTAVGTAGNWAFVMAFTLLNIAVLCCSKKFFSAHFCYLIGDSWGHHILFLFFLKLSGNLPVLVCVHSFPQFHANTFYLLLATFQAGTSARHIEVKLSAFWLVGPPMSATRINASRLLSCFTWCCSCLQGIRGSANAGELSWIVASYRWG